MRRRVEIDYIEYWVIRVVRDSGNNKQVIKEVEFPIPPTEKDIIDILYTCKNNEFISVEHNYKRG